MIKKTKKTILYSVLFLAILSFGACTHEAGVLDKCLGKNLAIDTSSTAGIYAGSIPGEIYFDSINIITDIRKAPFFGSIDGGKHWKLLPFDTMNLRNGIYNLIAKDADSCLTPVYAFKVTN